MHSRLLFLLAALLASCNLDMGSRGPSGDPNYSDPEPEPTYTPPPEWTFRGSSHLKYGADERPCFDAAVQALRHMEYRIEDAGGRGRKYGSITGFHPHQDTSFHITFYRHDHKTRVTIEVSSREMTNFECAEAAAHLHQDLGAILGEQGH